MVELVEKDQLGDTKKVKDTLNFYIQKDQGESLDSIVLGCTHFIFYKKTLRQLLPDSVQIVDGNEGTAAHLKDLLGQKQLLSNKKTGKVEIKNTLEEKVEYSKKLFQRLEECK